MTALNAGGLRDRKHAVCSAVAARTAQLLALSHDLHAHPETAWKEVRSAKLVASWLSTAGLTITQPAYGLSTAFRAEAGSSGPLVVICCEYDALPELGHACGHNIVATCGAGAGAVLAPLAAELGGRLRVLGTPAEEGGGGKLVLLARGAFAGASSVMLAHPGPYDSVDTRFRAAASFTITFRGRAAHAGMAPHLGRNALDAAVLTYQAIAAGRAALTPGEQLTAVIGTSGHAPNVVPARAQLRIMARAPGAAGLARLRCRIERAAHGGALATGCVVVIRAAGPSYAALVADPWLTARFAANARALGRSPRPGSDLDLLTAGSTDLGDVSQVVPTIHPKLGIGPVPQHSVAFAAAARSPAGDHAVLDGARALAMTAIDVWTIR